MAEISNREIVEKLHNVMMRAIVLECAVLGEKGGEIREALMALSGDVIGELRELRDSLEEQWGIEHVKRM